MAPWIYIKSNEEGDRASKILTLANLEHSLENESNSSQNKNSNFLYIPSIGLDVAKEKTLFNNNFYEAQKKLHSENKKMLTLNEFREFLKFAKKEDSLLYNEITQVKSPWRSEWLDADFKMEGDNMYVVYHTFENDKIVEKREKLDKNTLMNNKTSGVCLDSWLENSTKQGLPSKETESGNLYYFAPMKDNNSVVWFVADGYRVYLVAYRYPDDRISNLGVRAAKQHK